VRTNADGYHHFVSAVVILSLLVYSFGWISGLLLLALAIIAVMESGLLELGQRVASLEAFAEKQGRLGQARLGQPQR
jgi:hypothetical protein